MCARALGASASELICASETEDSRNFTLWKSENPLLQSRYHFAIQLGASAEGLCVFSPCLPLPFCGKMKSIYDPTKRNETNNKFVPPDIVKMEKWNDLYCVNIDS